MQRPIILTAKHRLYGDTFDMSQTHQHAYELVQPLQAGRITFVQNTDPYINNLQWKKHKEGAPESTFVLLSWDTIIWLLVLVVTVGCMVLTGLFDQTAFNEVYLTQFYHQIDTVTYSLQYAGKIRPLQYIIAALTCFCSSFIFGWQSNHDIRLNQYLSWGVSLVIVVLQFWGFILHATTLTGNIDVNHIMLSVDSIFFLHLATWFITLVILVYQGYGIKEEIESEILDQQKTINMFWITVAEDLNSIVGYVLVVTAFNALSSVHDDSTLFFDVVCVVTIGFLQHVANVLMIFHRHVCVDVPSNLKDDERKRIVNTIARSRLIIFFFVGIVVVFFYLRISPTYEAFTLGIPYEMLRVLAIITMVSLGTLHSIWYEFRQADEKKEWETSPTWKLVTAAFIALVFSAFVYQNAGREVDTKIKHYLIDAKAIS
jgi:uncharacterized membrane protein